jgi:sirohydrochlorin ferrochelatase
MSESHTFLLDNGSLEPAATLRLRELARALSEHARALIEPVSLLHSSGVPAAALDGTRAEIFEPAVVRRAEGGARDFLIVPLFFGPSRALTEYLPERVRSLREKFPDLVVRLAPALFSADDSRLARILADNVRTIAAASARVALVDHGSPVRVVTEVREALARQLARELGAATEVIGCCMERRPEPAYDFNEPMLEKLLARDGWNASDVVIAMQFLLPGRHAGPRGDVAEICRRAEAASPGLRAQLTPLVAEHPLLVEILADRWRAGQQIAPL